MEDKQSNMSVKLNVSGTTFEISNKTWASILKNIPGKLNSEFTLVSDSHYFIERHSSAFNAILYHYQGEELHIPSDVCPSSFKKEMEFWGLEETALAKCCYQKYVTFFDDQDVLKILEKDEGENIKEKEKLTTMSGWPGWRGFQAKMWLVLNEPLYSRTSKIYFGISVFVIIISLLALIFGTHPVFQRSLTVSEWKEYYGDDWDKFKHYFISVPKSEPATAESEPESESETSSEPEAETSSEPETTSAEPSSESETSSEPETTSTEEPAAEEPRPIPENAFARYSYLNYIEYICIALFTFDIIIRIIFSPFKLKLLKSFLFWVDVFAVSVMYTKYIVEFYFPKEKYEASFLDILHCLQIVRVFRLFRLVKNFIGFRVLLYAFRASFKEMLLMMLFLIIAVLMFSTFAFFSGDDSFPSIPDAIWWAVVTMTTVGYGDVTPKDALSKFIGAFCALSGVCLIAVIIPIFVNNFLLFYAYSKVWGRREEKKKLKEQKIKITQVQAFDPVKTNGTFNSWQS